MNYPKQGSVIYLDDESPAMAIRIKRATLAVPENMVKKLKAFDKWAEETNPPILDFIDRLYSLADDFMSIRSEYTVCQKGCPACCNIAVSVSGVEAHYLSSKAGVPMRPIHTLLPSADPINEYSGVPCPFLDKKNKCCSAYEYRPLACRMFAAFDHPKYCQSNNKPHFITTAYSHPFFLNIQRNLEAISSRTLAVQPLDIREWFVRKDA